MVESGFVSSFPGKPLWLLSFRVSETFQNGLSDFPPVSIRLGSDCG